ncbi:MAG: hypothetical protein Q9227_001730 [Pyrenula ochraceoflavens]
MVRDRRRVSTNDGLIAVSSQEATDEDEERLFRWRRGNKEACLICSWLSRVKSSQELQHTEQTVALSSHAPLNIDDFYEYYDPNDERQVSRQEHNSTPDSQRLLQELERIEYNPRPNSQRSRSRPTSQHSRSSRRRRVSGSYYEYSEQEHPQQQARPESRRSRSQVRQFSYLTSYDHPLQQDIPARSPSSSQRPPTSSSIRQLRRTPRLPERNPSRVRATSLPPAFEVLQQVASAPLESTQVSPVEFEDIHPERQFALSTTTSGEFQRIVNDESFWPERNTRISRRTHEAILFAVEAIRRGKGKDYWHLTPDTVEENASMSDLTGGRAPAGTAARTQNGGPRAATTSMPVTERTPERLRTPTDVMRHARARIARQEAEREASRQQEEDRRRREQELASAELPTQRRSGGRRSGGDSQYDIQPADTSTQRRSGGRRSGTEAQFEPQTSIPAAQPQAGRRAETHPSTATTRQRRASLDQGQPRPVQSQARTAPSRYDQPSSRRSRTDTGRQADGDTADGPDIAASRKESRAPPSSGQQASSQPQASQAQSQTQRTPFPHAFERWETLSSHWEGLTGYWIRRLQENESELRNEPLSQQMSRQITDLSAAGANLFHAVVELQRLRASSERKFQRWFFEHRTEQERFQEVQSGLERSLQTERQSRQDAIASSNAAEAERLKAEELVKEMRRELNISKEEARRAWEELGRREQVEREWTVSLQNGQPTIVGGVQVVPMTQGVPSRRTSTRDRPPTREGPYAGGPGANVMGGQHRDDYGGDYDSRSYQPGPGTTSPTETDPFTQGSLTDPSQLHQEPDYPRAEDYYQQPRTQPPSSAAAMASRTSVSPAPHHGYPTASVPTTAPSTTRFYHHDGPTSSLQPQQPGPTATTAPSVHSATETRSYIPSTISDPESDDAEYEIDQYGNLRRDSQGRRIPFRGPSAGPPSSALSEGESDELDVSDAMARERAYAQQYSSSNNSQAAPAPPPAVPTAPGAVPADYSGQGWGSGWEGVGITPRHRHPTRLSDVLEEDERSRATSPNRGSMVGSAVEGVSSGGASSGGQRLAGIREEVRGERRR